MSFHHGVKTVEVQSGSVPVLDIASAIVGAFGTATTAMVGSIVKTLNYDEAKEKLGAGTLLESLRRIYIYSPSATVLSFVLGAPLTRDDSEKPKSKKTLIEIDDDLNIESTRQSDPLYASFIETLPKIRTCKMAFGFNPKIFIAPGIIDKPGAAAQALSATRSLRGFWITEPPAASTEISAKAFSNNINDYRAACYYPRVKIVNEDGSISLDWAAPSYAGLIIQMDKNLTGEPLQTGYWCSPSNLKLVDVVGSEFDFEYTPSDLDCTVNQLNASGMVTTINFNGLRAFGNRSTAFPAKSDAVSFICWRRTLDVIQEAIEDFTMQFLDRPMFTQPDDIAGSLLGRVVDSINDYLRGLIGTSLVYGECCIKVEQNPLSELMQGKVKIHYKATPPIAMECVEYELEVYVKGLEDAMQQLFGGANA